MDEDWEDFLGLDEPTQSKSNETQPHLQKVSHDDRSFELPNDITPLSSNSRQQESYEIESGSEFSPKLDVDRADPPGKRHHSPEVDALGNCSSNEQTKDFFNVDNIMDEELVTKEPDTAGGSRNMDSKTTKLHSQTPDDFMSWLDDNKEATQQKLESGNSSPSNSKQVVDNFFDEVFGEDNNATVLGSNNTSSMNFESQLRKEIASSFCDANKIRNLIHGAGYLPRSLRGQIWSILIAGGCSEDQEAEFWRPSGKEHIENKSQLYNDSAGAVAKLRGTVYSPTDLEQTEIDMSDILLLYCMRRKKIYRRFYSSILSPLLVTPMPSSRALASSCFYVLCSDFIPLINLSTFGYDEAVRKICEWVRLLVLYHFPLLVLHLDRVFPGWELPMRHHSTTEVVNISAEARSNASLDEMEESLGLTGGSNLSVTEQIDSLSSPLPKEDRCRDDTDSGCIPTPWLSGIFGDSLPPEEAASILDWSVLTTDRYFGVYFTAAFFGLYSSSLMNMNRVQVKTWMMKVYSGITSESTDWFASIPLSVSPVLNKDDEAKEVKMDWKIFMRGWLHAATALRHLTPNSFKEAVANTEVWASSLNSEEKNEPVGANVESGFDGGGSMDSKRAKMLKMKNTVEEKSRNVLRRFSKKVETVRKLSQGIEVDNLDKWEEDEDESREWMLWPHMNKKNYRCLWSAAREVIPSMCATQRKSNIPDDGASKTIFDHFCHGCEWTDRISEYGIERKGGEGMSFPQFRDEQHSLLPSPMFFTVDIRTESEMKLGKFPKAFSLDPQFLSDPDIISSYLSTLEPVSEIAHLCVMGVGEEYIQAKVAPSKGFQQPQNSLDTPSSSFALIDEALAEYHATLMNVVTFFLKKGFRHVSILDGGFIAVVRHLLRDDCSSSLGSALVDVFPPALDAVLGEGTCAKHLGIKKITASTDLYSEKDENFHMTGNGGGSGSLLGTSVNNAFATLSNSSVGANLGSFVSNIAAQVPTSSTTVSENEETNVASSTAEVGRRLSILGSSALTSIRKSVSVVTGSQSEFSSTANSSVGDMRSDMTRAHSNVKQATQEKKSTSGGGMQFVIDEEDEEEEDNDVDDDSNALEKRDSGTGSKNNEMKMQRTSLADTIPDTNTVAVSRTEAEKSQALAMHILAGVRKGDEVKIEKASLPGAVLFPALKDKIEKDDDGLVLLDTRGQPKTKPVHRFLVVTKERFIVLDSKGQGVGSIGIVKSNHHLTELIKITFKKKDPDGVVLFKSAPGKEPKPHSYKVAKRNDFIRTLQDKMKRFK